VVLGVFEPAALSAKMLFVAAAGLATSSSDGSSSSSSSSSGEASDGGLGVPPLWLLWWLVPLHLSYFYCGRHA
jgi:hypothetical protein